MVNEQKTFQTTLRDLLHAINILGGDRDICVDGIDSIAVCPPIMMTPEGREYFAEALNAGVEVLYRYNEHYDTYVSSADEKTNEKAWELLASLAGYCPASKFPKWFEGETAEMI